MKPCAILILLLTMTLACDTTPAPPNAPKPLDSAQLSQPRQDPNCPSGTLMHGAAPPHGYFLSCRPPAGTPPGMGSTAEPGLPDSDYPRANRENLALSIVTPPEGGLKILDKTRKGLMVPIAEARYRPADRWRPLKTLNHPLGVFICYESVYPRVGQALAEADVLAVITNDAGLRWSTTPTGHVRLGKLRAVESGRSLIHAGQAGISFMLDPYGRSTPRLELFERGVLFGAVSAKRVWTLYGVIGQWWVVIFGALWLASLAKAWMEAKSQV